MVTNSLEISERHSLFLKIHNRAVLKRHMSRIKAGAMVLSLFVLWLLVFKFLMQGQLGVTIGSLCAMLCCLPLPGLAYGILGAKVRMLSDSVCVSIGVQMDWEISLEEFAKGVEFECYEAITFVRMPKVRLAFVSVCMVLPTAEAVILRNAIKARLEAVAGPK
jgi:hypothetical protein